MSLEFKIDNKGREVFVKEHNMTPTKGNVMPKKAKPEPEDDLEIEDTEDEEETEEEEDETEDADDEEDADEEEEEGDDEETEEESEDEEEEAEPTVKKRGRPPGIKNSPEPTGKKQLGIVLLKNGIAKKVEIIKVMGKNVKVRKPGDKNFPAVRVPITDCRLYEKAAFEKMEEINGKIGSWRDKNGGLFQKLGTLAARKGAGPKINPLEEL